MKKAIKTNLTLVLLSVTAFLAAGCASGEAQPSQKTASVSGTAVTEISNSTTTVTTAKVTAAKTTASAHSSSTSGATSTSSSVNSETAKSSTASSAQVNATITQTAAKNSSVINSFTMNSWVRGCFNGTENSAVVQLSSANQEKCCLINMNDGSIFRSINIGTQLNSLLGTFNDGTIVCEDVEMRNLLLYDPNSSNPKVLSLGKDRDIFNMWLDPVKDRVFWTQNDNIIRSIDSNGKITETAEIEMFEHIYEIYPERNSLLVNEYSEDSVNGLQPALYSLDTGEKMFELNSNTVYNSGFTKDKFFDTNISYDGGITEINVYDLASQRFEKQYQLSCSSTTPFFISSNYSNDLIITEFASNGTGNLQSIKFLNLVTGEIYESGIDVKNANYINISACCNASADRWMFVLDNADVSTGQNCFKIVNPTVLQYSRTLNATTTQKANAKRYEAGAGYKTVKAEAEKIEKEFGVRILVGDEVFNAEVNSSFKFHSSESFRDAAEMIEKLNELRIILSEYPKGFFEHFKMKNGKFGLRISLVEELESIDYDVFSAAGVAYRTGQWYDIAFDNCYIYDHTLLHHEMWHTVENLVSEKYMLDENAWNKLNPINHNYTNDFDGYAENNVIDINTLEKALMSDNPNFESIYFARDYSHVTPMEDRATLIEALFSWYCSWNTVSDPVAEMNRYPHLKAKLDFLAEYSRQEFGYVYWEEMLQAMKEAA